MKATTNSLFIFLIAALLFSLNGCSESNSPSSENNSVMFLMGYKGGESGPFGNKYGIVLVDSKGSATWVCEYYPFHNSTDYVDINNGRIAFASEKFPDGSSPIAYFDVNDVKNGSMNVKFMPIPPSNDKDYYWAVPRGVRPQVFKDGRILFFAVWNTVNPYDDWHDGVLGIYNPKTNDFTFFPFLSNFVLSQPEKGYDTEGGSMAGNFVLSQDESFVILEAYGYGTDAGVYHTDYHFLVKLDLNNSSYSRILCSSSTINFVTFDNKYVVVDIEGKKYRVDVNTGDKAKIDDYSEYICKGKYSTKNYLFFKTWRGAGITMLDAISGFVYHPILGDSLPYPYKGCGTTGQFSKDESKIYFTASTDFYTNRASPFVVYSTPLTGVTNSKPDSLFQMEKWFDTPLFLLIK